MKKKIYISVRDVNEIDIIMYDGGMASIHNNGTNFITTYFQNRLTPQQIMSDNFETLYEESKSYVKEWDVDIKTLTPPMIMDAIQWLNPNINTEDCKFILIDNKSFLKKEFVNILINNL